MILQKMNKIKGTVRKEAVPLLVDTDNLIDYDFSPDMP